MSTIDSEEPTLGMSPTDLRRVLPNMGLAFPPPKQRFHQVRGAPTSEEADLPHGHCSDPREGLTASAEPE
jgi:hypothetical protein